MQTTRKWLIGAILVGVIILVSTGLWVAYHELQNMCICS